MPDIVQVARSTRHALFGLGGIWDDLKSQWDAAVADFQARRLELDQAESALYAVADAAREDPDDTAEWERVFAQVNAAKSGMDAVAGTLTQIAEWWSTFNEWSGFAGPRNGLAGRLGIALPAFPLTLAMIVGLIAGASAAIAAAYGFVSYVNLKTGRVNQLIAAGVPAVEAVEIATREAQATSGYSFGARMEKIVMWGALGLAAVFVLPKLLDWRTK